MAKKGASGALAYTRLTPISADLTAQSSTMAAVAERERARRLEQDQRAREEKATKMAKKYEEYKGIDPDKMHGHWVDEINKVVTRDAVKLAEYTQAAKEAHASGDYKTEYDYIKKISNINSRADDLERMINTQNEFYTKVLGKVGQKDGYDIELNKDAIGELTKIIFGNQIGIEIGEDESTLFKIGEGDNSFTQSIGEFSTRPYNIELRPNTNVASITYDFVDGLGTSSKEYKKDDGSIDYDKMTKDGWDLFYRDIGMNPNFKDKFLLKRSSMFDKNEDGSIDDSEYKDGLKIYYNQVVKNRTDTTEKDAEAEPTAEEKKEQKKLEKFGELVGKSTRVVGYKDTDGVITKTYEMEYDEMDLAPLIGQWKSTNQSSDKFMVNDWTSDLGSEVYVQGNKIDPKQRRMTSQAITLNDFNVNRLTKRTIFNGTPIEGEEYIEVKDSDNNTRRLYVGEEIKGEMRNMDGSEITDVENIITADGVIKAKTEKKGGQMISLQIAVPIKKGNNLYNSINNKTDGAVDFFIDREDYNKNIDESIKEDVKVDETESEDYTNVRSVRDTETNELIEIGYDPKKQSWVNIKTCETL